METLEQAIEAYSTDGRKATATTTQHGYIRLTLTGPTGRTKTHLLGNATFAAWFLDTDTAKQEVQEQEAQEETEAVLLMRSIDRQIEEAQRDDLTEDEIIANRFL